MENDQDKQTRLMALAAIAIDEPSDANGDKPDMEELWDWMAGFVEPERAVQIKSHIARDSELYSQWRELRLALDEGSQEMAVAGAELPNRATEKQTPSSPSSSLFERFLGWLSPAPLGGAFATAAILGIAISVGLNQNRQQQEFWADWQSPKGLNQTEVEAEDVALAQSFLSGMGKQMQELSIPALGPAGQDLINEAESCGDNDEDCELRRSLMSELGEISVLSKLACVAGQDVGSEHVPRISSILELVEQDEKMGLFLAPVRQWSAAADSKARCGAVNTLIQRGLTGAAAGSNGNG